MITAKVKPGETWKSSDGEIVTIDKVTLDAYTNVVHFDGKSLSEQEFLDMFKRS